MTGRFALYKSQPLLIDFDEKNTDGTQDTQINSKYTCDFALTLFTLKFGVSLIMGNLFNGLNLK